jgi:hypothetical protein
MVGEYVTNALLNKGQVQGLSETSRGALSVALVSYDTLETNSGLLHYFPITKRAIEMAQYMVRTV